MLFVELGSGNADPPRGSAIRGTARSSCRRIECAPEVRWLWVQYCFRPLWEDEMQTLHTGT